MALAFLLVGTGRALGQADVVLRPFANVPDVAVEVARLADAVPEYVATRLTQALSGELRHELDAGKTLSEAIDHISEGGFRRVFDRWQRDAALECQDAAGPDATCPLFTPIERGVVVLTDLLEGRLLVQRLGGFLMDELRAVSDERVAVVDDLVRTGLADAFARLSRFEQDVGFARAVVAGGGGDLVAREGGWLALLPRVIEELGMGNEVLDLVTMLSEVIDDVSDVLRDIEDARRGMHQRLQDADDEMSAVLERFNAERDVSREQAAASLGGYVDELDQLFEPLLSDGGALVDSIDRVLVERLERSVSAVRDGLTELALAFGVASLADVEVRLPTRLPLFQGFEMVASNVSMESVSLRADFALVRLTSQVAGEGGRPVCNEDPTDCARIDAGIRILGVRFHPWPTPATEGDAGGPRSSPALDLSEARVEVRDPVVSRFLSSMGLTNLFSDVSASLNVGGCTLPAGDGIGRACAGLRVSAAELSSGDIAVDFTATLPPFAWFAASAPLDQSPSITLHCGPAGCEVDGSAVVGSLSGALQTRAMAALDRAIEALRDHVPEEIEIATTMESGESGKRFVVSLDLAGFLEDALGLSVAGPVVVRAEVIRSAATGLSVRWSADLAALQAATAGLADVLADAVAFPEALVTDRLDFAVTDDGIELHVRFDVALVAACQRPLVVRIRLDDAADRALDGLQEFARDLTGCLLEEAARVGAEDLEKTFGRCLVPDTGVVRAHAIESDGGCVLILSFGDVPVLRLDVLIGGRVQLTTEPVSGTRLPVFGVNGDLGIYVRQASGLVAPPAAWPPTDEGWALLGTQCGDDACARGKKILADAVGTALGVAGTSLAAGSSAHVGIGASVAAHDQVRFPVYLSLPRLGTVTIASLDVGTEGVVYRAHGDVEGDLRAKLQATIESFLKDYGALAIDALGPVSDVSVTVANDGEGLTIEASGAIALPLGSALDITLDITYDVLSGSTEVAVDAGAVRDALGELIPVDLLCSSASFSCEFSVEVIESKPFGVLVRLEDVALLLAGDRQVHLGSHEIRVTTAGVEWNPTLSFPLGQVPIAYPVMLEDATVTIALEPFALTISGALVMAPDTGGVANVASVLTLNVEDLTLALSGTVLLVGTAVARGSANLTIDPFSLDAGFTTLPPLSTVVDTDHRLFIGGDRADFRTRMAILGLRVADSVLQVDANARTADFHMRLGLPVVPIDASVVFREGFTLDHAEGSIDVLNVFSVSLSGASVRLEPDFARLGATVLGLGLTLTVPSPSDLTADRVWRAVLELLRFDGMFEALLNALLDPGSVTIVPFTSWGADGDATVGDGRRHTRPTEVSSHGTEGAGVVEVPAVVGPRGSSGDVFDGASPMDEVAPSIAVAVPRGSFVARFVPLDGAPDGCGSEDGRYQFALAAADVTDATRRVPLGAPVRGSVCAQAQAWDLVMDIGVDQDHAVVFTSEAAPGASGSSGCDESVGDVHVLVLREGGEWTRLCGVNHGDLVAADVPAEGETAQQYSNGAYAALSIVVRALARDRGAKMTVLRSKDVVTAFLVDVDDGNGRSNTTLVENAYGAILSVGPELADLLRGAVDGSELVTAMRMDADLPHTEAALIWAGSDVDGNGELNGEVVWLVGERRDGCGHSVSVSELSGDGACLVIVSIERGVSQAPRVMRVRVEQPSTVRAWCAFTCVPWPSTGLKFAEISELQAHFDVERETMAVFYSDTYATFVGETASRDGRRFKPFTRASLESVLRDEAATCDRNAPLPDDYAFDQAQLLRFLVTDDDDAWRTCSPVSVLAAEAVRRSDEEVP